MQSLSLKSFVHLGFSCRVRKIRESGHEVLLGRKQNKTQNTRVYSAQDYHYELIFGNEVLLK